MNKEAVAYLKEYCLDRETGTPLEDDDATEILANLLDIFFLEAIRNG